MLGSIYDKHYQIVSCSQSIRHSNFVSYFSVPKCHFLDHKFVFGTIRPTSTSYLFQWKEIVFLRCQNFLSVRTDVRMLQFVERQVIGGYFLGSFVSFLVASKYFVPSHIHLGVFSGFSIISFSKLVNVTWDDERAFNQKFRTLSAPDGFHFCDLVNAVFSSSVFPFLFVYFLISFLHIPC